MEKSLVERFQKLFTGCDACFGEYVIEGAKRRRKDNKVEGKARTRTDQLIDLSHYESHLVGTTGLGIAPIIRETNLSVFGAIDIDDYDLDFEQLNRDIVRYKLPLVPCRTKSGGAHLYVFLSEPCAPRDLREQLADISAMLGFPGVEVFPKQDSVDIDLDASPTTWQLANWINLPYFDVDAPTVRYALDHEGKAILELEPFLVFCESKVVDTETFLSEEYEEDAEVPFVDGPPCLQSIDRRGLPEGTRNNSLFNIGVYYKKKFPDDWREKLDSYNSTLEAPVPSSEVVIIQKSLDKKKYFYTCSQEPIVSFCNKPVCLRRKYGIGGGTSDLEALLGNLEKTVTVDDKGREVEDVPHWYLYVGEHRITLTTAQLLNQDQLRARLTETVRKFPGKIPVPRYEMLMREKIENASTIEISYETALQGKIHTAIHDFCGMYGDAENKIEIEEGKAWRDEEGFFWFKTRAFWDFLVAKQIFRHTQNPKEYPQIMRELGAEKAQLMVDRSRNINRMCWCIKDWEAVEIPAEELAKEPTSSF